MKKFSIIVIVFLLMAYVIYWGFIYWNFVWFKEKRQGKIWNERIYNKNKHRKIENKIYTEQDKEK